jgi:hypothetical protein
MRRAPSLLFLTLLVGGCATAAPPGTTAYTGEVWVWDDRASIVTLRQPGGLIRVQVTPDQMVGLQMHQTTTVRGVIAPPVEIEQVVVTTEAVPVGAVDHVAATATVRSVTPEGVMAVDSDHGPLTLLIARPPAGRYGPGARVRVQTAVQAMQLVPAGSAPHTASSSSMLAPTPEPEDSVVVTGRVLGVEASGTVRIESPRGAISLWVPNAERFRVNDFIRVRMVVAATP